MLAKLENERGAGAWISGRAGELRAVVTCAVQDWRAGMRDEAATRWAIISYIEGLRE